MSSEKVSDNPKSHQNSHNERKKNTTWLIAGPNSPSNDIPSDEPKSQQSQQSQPPSMPHADTTQDELTISP